MFALLPRNLATPLHTQMIVCVNLLAVGVKEPSYATAHTQMNMRVNDLYVLRSHIVVW